MKPTEDRAQQGQILITAVLFMSVVLGLTAMAIDVGLFYHERRQFQNSADAMALAGVAELPLNPLQARAKAEEWAGNNDVDSSEIKSIEVRTTGFPNDTLYVELEGEFSWIFARVLGNDTDNVGAEAAARTGSLAGGHDMMPWSILQGDSDCLDAQGKPIFAASCSVKVGAQSKFGGGWRGALDLDGNGGGANEYRDNIIDGQADTYYCIDGQVVPPCETSIVDIKSGNMVGPTEQGIEGHLAVGPQCDANSNGKDDFEEVFQPTGQVSPAYTVVCPDSPWLVIIPIVEYDGGQTVKIKGWALSYIKEYGCVDSSAAHLSEQSVVFGGESQPGGVATHSAKGEKPCHHNKDKEQTPVAEAAEPMVMAIGPGEPLPPSLRGPNKPPACHTGQPHGQQQCTPSPTPTPPPAATPTQTPTPAPTSAPTPTPTAAPAVTPTPGGGPTPTPGPPPLGDCKSGKGHWEVQIQIADATYSQSEGFLGAFDPTSPILIRRLIK